MSIRFASSHHNDMRPLAFQGVRATNCYDQLQALLEQNAAFLARHGMPDAGTFLAEPMHDSRSGCIDWYTNTKETPVPLSELREEEQAAVKERLARCGAAMQALFDAQGRSAPGMRGTSEADPMAIGLLKLALQHPSPSDIYVAGGRPILTNWGFRQGTGEAAPEDILREGVEPAPLAAPRPTPAPPTTPPVPPVATVTPPAPAGRPGCLPWLLPLPFLLLLLFLLASLLDLLPAGCSGFLPDRTEEPVDDGATKGEVMRKAALGDEYARLLADLSARAALCRPAPKEEEPEEQEPVIPDLSQPKPEPEPEEKKADVPFFGDPPVMPKEEKKPPVKKEEKKPPVKKEKPKAETPKPKKNEDMKIPENAAKTNDLSFLEGCWKSDTGLYNNHGVPVDAEYCFDKRGHGRRFVREPNGQRCSGSVTAKFQGKKLTMKGSRAPCPRGGEYVPQSIICTGSGKATQCRGQELGGSRNRWKHRFTRK